MYIDYSKLYDFSKEKTFNDVLLDIKDVYQITNILDDHYESLFDIADALYTDYKYKHANYESYIEKGMDARFMMELRKSARIRTGEKFAHFFALHANCKTVSDVKKLRTDFIGKIFVEYQDLDWQYYYLIIITGHNLEECFMFDYESCFADGDYMKQTTIENYEADFIRAHTLGMNN